MHGLEGMGKQETLGAGSESSQIFCRNRGGTGSEDGILWGKSGRGLINGAFDSEIF